MAKKKAKEKSIYTYKCKVVFTDGSSSAKTQAGYGLKDAEERLSSAYWFTSSRNIKTVSSVKCKRIY